MKHENHQPTAAFKVRGGLNLVAQLPAAERERGLITASTGNHGQSIAYAARLHGVAATICVPEGANPLKVAAIRAMGAEIVVHGRDFDEAREHCEQLAARDGSRYVHSGNEPHLIAGVATATLEMLEDDPGLDAIIVPVGGGSGAAGACIVGEGAPAGDRGHRRPVGGRAGGAALLEHPSAGLCGRMETFAEGLATRVAFELPQRILWRHLDDFVLVSEADLRAATARMIAATSTLVEAAGRRTARGGDAPARPARREAGGADRKRRQHQPRPAPGAARANAVDAG